MHSLLVVFSHGKESGPWGCKILKLAEVARAAGAQVLSVDCRTDAAGVAQDHHQAGEAERRVKQLLATPLPAHDQLVLVGSSMGGYVATAATAKLATAGLFLLAPAFYLPGYTDQSPRSAAGCTSVVHGWADDVVPQDNSVRFARFQQCDLHLLPGDHRLDSSMQVIKPLFRDFLQTVIDAGQDAAKPAPG